MQKTNKNALYESIMSNVAREVKKALREVCNKPLSESRIIDEIGRLHVSRWDIRGAYEGRFTIKIDNMSHFEFQADAWLQDDDEVKVSVRADQDDYFDIRMKQLCNSPKFQKMCKNAIISEYPTYIEGFDILVKNVGSYDGALEIVTRQIEEI